MIGPFRGEHRWLSNFWHVGVWLSDELYPSVEHAYQAAKTDDSEQRAQIQSAPTPGVAKRLGRRISIREDWDEVKITYMHDLVLQKFKNYPNLRRKLLATGDQNIVEINTWNDTFWGMCNGVGENHLGRILMSVRAALRT